MHKKCSLLGMKNCAITKENRKNRTLSRFSPIGFFVLFSVFSAVNLSAQSDDWYYNKKIKQIVFKTLQNTDLRNVKASDAEAVVKPYIGQAFTDALYSEMLGRIYQLDFFEPTSLDLEITPLDAKNQTLKILFKVKERPLVTKITVSGNKGIRTTEIKDAVSTKERNIYLEGTRLNDEHAIRTLYITKGFSDVKVTSAAETDKNGAVQVTFTIIEGNATIVTAIKFQGNISISERTLKRQLETQEAFGLIRSGAFQESALTGDKQAIASYYQNRGFIDVAVTDVKREESYNEKKQHRELTLTFVLTEGKQYTFGGITFSGNTLFTTQKLLSLVRQKNGEIFNATRFQEGIAGVTDLYYENGYTSNGFNLEQQKDERLARISFAFSIVERPRSHVEKITIRGNTKTKTPVILREIPIESGDIFSKAKFTAGMRNLYNLQYFKSILPDVVQGSEENLVEIIINVEEQPTTQVEFGVTYSGTSNPDELPLSLFAKLSDLNLFGTGKNGSAQLNLSTTEKSGAIGYGDPWFLGSPLSFSANLSIAYKTLTTLQNIVLPGETTPSNDVYSYLDYNQISTSLSVGVGHRWIPEFAILSLAGGVSTSLESNMYDAGLYSPADSSIADFQGRLGVKNTVWSSFSMDGRDINFDPSRGWFFSQRLGWTGLIPGVENEFFLRSDTKAEGYVTLFNHQFTDRWGLKFVLAGYTGLSFLFPQDTSSIGRDSKLYIDGMFTGRGWNQPSVYNTRGEAQLYSYVELRMPVVPGIFSIDFFVDAIALKDKPRDLFTNLGIEDFYFSFGPGIRCSMPQFPIRILFPILFQVKDGQTVWGNGASKPQMGVTLSFNVINR
ncbi:MAG: outer membrane protein assembly factor BamA [Treponemataceae bacterium]|nr:MAG: outer membrane protein assembly factor BamA [Treponemataceae bacterium]